MMIKSHPISRKVFAEMCGLAKSTITKACGQPKKLLKAVNDDGAINFYHPQAQAYFKTRTEVMVGGSLLPPGKMAVKTRNTAQLLPELDYKDNLRMLPQDIRKLADHPLNELVRTFGTDTRFVTWMTALKKIEDVYKVRLDSASKESVLVHRDLIRRGVLDPLDEFFTRVLTDGTKTLTRTVLSKHDAGRTFEECELYVREQISSFIKPLKDRMRRALERIEGDGDG